MVAQYGLIDVALITQIVCITVVSLFVALRYVAKYRLRLSFGIEDVFCALAWFFYVAQCSCTLVFTYIAGKVTADFTMTSDQIMTKYKVFYSMGFVYVFMTLFVKLTLLTLIIRIFKPHATRIAFVYTFVVIIILYYISILFVKIFICTPIHAYWDDWENDRGSGRCVNRPAVIIADSSVSTATDVMILIFPIILIWSVKIPMAKKVGVVCVLGAGSIAVAFSLYRLILVCVDSQTPHQMAIILKVLLTDNAEGGIGLICACLPALNGLGHAIARRHSERKGQQGKQAPSTQSTDRTRILQNMSSKRASSVPETDIEGSEDWAQVSLSGDTV